ncbi:trihelix transcription factor DF1-like [Apium graveolens]|uniref:trihelix transcription factor DF1-like n=1 Tax=Apium graveolens TaxID=4045 RepID=UPI003D78D88F
MMLQQQQQQQAGTVVGSSGEDTVAAQEAHEGGGGGSGGSGGGINEEEKGRSEDSERNSGGSRWPRQETIALLKIRSDMDVAFRDSSLKGPLWDEVSRKLLELGYHRSAKKCKEKFENVYKYHKRTKDGRNSKADGKTYRFFEQLEALDTNPSATLSSVMKPQGAAHQTIFTSATLVGNNSTINISNSPTVVTNVTVSSTPSPISTVFPSNAIHPINLLNIPSHQNVTNPTNPTHKSTGNHSNLPPSYSTHNPNMDFLSNSTSSTSSDEQPERYGKRKRKWEDFFGRLMSEVMQKQDELQQKFLDTLEKRERDRVAREEAWRVQEMAKMNREHELLLQERSMAAAKDAAVISFLQKITEQQQKNSPNNPITVPPILNQVHSHLQTPPPQPPVQVPQQPAPVPTPVIVTAPVPAPALAPVPAPALAPAPAPATMTIKRIDDMNAQSSNYNEGSENANLMSPSPSRWPKTEVQALIKLRSTLDTKYHENGPKGPLWEEISSAMRKMGYNRNAKRCKEKWENINKYYKKVKESNKKRPEDAKTCPYFHQLEALYKEKARTDNIIGSTINHSFNSSPINAAPLTIMAQPEQQWPQEKQHPQNKDEDLEDANMNEDDYEDEDDEDDGAGYEIVTNKQHQQQQDQTTVE